jgi:hypothetical protein
MARQQVITYKDDLTGETVEASAIQTIGIVVGRKTYELDISGKTYRTAIEPMISAGRLVPTGGTSIPIPQQATKPDKEQNRAMRTWWKANAGKNGIPSFNERGRIPSTVEDAYQQYGGAPIPKASGTRAAVEPEPETKPFPLPPKDLRSRARAVKAIPARKAAAASKAPATKVSPRVRGAKTTTSRAS